MSKEDLFDSLTRLAASGLPRRRMIKLSVASLAAAAFGRSAFATTCPPGKVADKSGDCCKADTIDKAGYCCSADEGRYLDPNGNCCSSFDAYGYCKGVTACEGATCATYSECFDNSSCFCGATYQGEGICQVSVSCAPLVLCPDGICAEGFFCLVNSCCGDPVCVPDTAECSEGANAKPQAAGGGKMTGPTHF